MAQSCLSNGVTFTSQGQIDSFPIQFPGCTNISGTVNVFDFANPDITNLDSLIQITSIEGELLIQNCSLLTNIEGLSSLNSIGGYLYIDDNSSLVSLLGLSGLSTIPGNFTITNEESLLNLNGLESLTTIGGLLYIAENPLIVNLNGLSSVTSVGSNLGIVGNPGLNSLNGLESLQSVNGSLQILNNPSLTSLVGIENIDYNSISELQISGCSQLSVCSVASICDYFEFGSNDAGIGNNSTGCNGVDQIESICNGCPSNGITFHSQGQIDSFPYNFPGCSLILGDLTISETLSGAIDNLDSLIQINSILGNLIIEGNETLNDLMGLISLSLFQGEIIISNNSSLTGLVGMDNCFGSISNLIIENNPNLSLCDIAPVCNYLQTPSHPASIHSNSPGCLSRGQILAFCSDIDTDGIIDSLDNCVNIYNPTQEDSDNDNTGDVCDYGTENNLGVGTDNPLTKLHVAGGVAFIDNNNGSLLMRSSDNSCWILKVSNSGVLSAIKVPCPE